MSQLEEMHGNHDPQYDMSHICCHNERQYSHELKLKECEVQKKNGMRTDFVCHTTVSEMNTRFQTKIVSTSGYSDQLKKMWSG